MNFFKSTLITLALGLFSNLRNKTHANMSYFCFIFCIFTTLCCNSSFT
jgi:hypothetical protein